MRKSNFQERCRQFADNQAIFQVRLLEKDSEIELLKAQLSTRAALDEQLRLSRTKLEAEVNILCFHLTIVKQN